AQTLRGSGLEDGISAATRCRRFRRRGVVLCGRGGRWTAQRPVGIGGCPCEPGSAGQGDRRRRTKAQGGAGHRWLGGPATEVRRDIDDQALKQGVKDRARDCPSLCHRKNLLYRSSRATPKRPITSAMDASKALSLWTFVYVIALAATIV